MKHCGGKRLSRPRGGVALFSKQVPRNCARTQTKKIIEILAG